MENNWIYFKGFNLLLIIILIVHVNIVFIYLLDYILLRLHDRLTDYFILMK